MPRKSASAGKKKRGPRPAPIATEGPVRLQRLLASAGYGSRRACEELIRDGRVVVDKEVVTKLGTTVDPDVQKVAVDGVLLKERKLVYFAVHKPIGFVTTNRDPQGRPRVVDLVPPDLRVFPVGRLDLNSEGLILLTNDGDLAQRLTHPRFGVRKVYRVTVAGKVDPETMKQMRRGIHIAEGMVRVEGAKILKSRSRSTEMEIVLREGKNREIRRILARLGHKVQHLRRIAVGPLRLGDLPSGAYRIVRPQEVDKLWAATSQEAVEAESGSGGPRGDRPYGDRSRSGGQYKKKAARKKTTGKSGPPSRPTRGKASEVAESFPFDPQASSTRGSVIGADSSDDRGDATSRGTKRARKSSRSTSDSRSRSGSGRKSAGGKKASSSRGSGRPAGKRTSKKASGKGTSRGGKGTSRGGKGTGRGSGKGRKRRG